MTRHPFIHTVFLASLMLSGLLLSLVSSCGGNTAVKKETAPEAHRIVSLSGAITETLYRMGYGDEIVGVDVTSTYPEEVHSKRKLGHARQLNTEGVIGLRPTLIFADANQKDNGQLQLLEKGGIKILYVETANTLDNALNIGKAVAKELGNGSATTLTALEKEIADAKEKLNNYQHQKAPPLKVLFIYARGPGQMMVAGEDTPASAMFDLVGVQNAASGFENFQSFSTEGLVAAQPDVILLFKSGLESLGGKEAFLEIKGVKETPAGKNQRIIAMDGAYLLGFGPRANRAALDLAEMVQK